MYNITNIVIKKPRTKISEMEQSVGQYIHTSTNTDYNLI